MARNPCKFTISVRTKSGERDEVDFDEFENQREQWEQDKEEEGEQITDEWTEVRSERQELVRPIFDDNNNEVGTIKVGNRFVLENINGRRIALNFDRTSEPET